MALLASQVMTVLASGAITPTYAACTGGGDTFVPDINTFVHIKNGSGGALTATFHTGELVTGMGINNQAVSVPATSEVMVGPFPFNVWANPSTGVTSITYSGVTSLTIGVFVVQPVN